MKLSFYLLLVQGFHITWFSIHKLLQNELISDLLEEKRIYMYIFLDKMCLNSMQLNGFKLSFILNYSKNLIVFENILILYSNPNYKLYD